MRRRLEEDRIKIYQDYDNLTRGIFAYTGGLKLTKSS